MRNVLLIAAMGTGAWISCQWAMHFGADLAPYLGSGPNPMSLLLALPALLVGGIAGALAGSIVLPRRY